MDSLAIRRISVWPDLSAPDQGAFAHACDWAEHLGLPLEAFAAADLSLDLGLKQFFRPDDLCVFGGALTADVKAILLRRAVHSADTPALVCSRSWQPVSRVLVLHRYRDLAGRFLDAAAHVCHCFRVRPVVLTVARTNAEARRRQRSVAEALAASGLDADFDAVVGADVGGAVASVARWRRCSHVFVDNRPAPPRWGWLRRGDADWLLGLSESLTFLTLPGTLAPNSIPEPTRMEPVANACTAPTKLG
jgi:hypothetical protein